MLQRTKIIVWIVGALLALVVLVWALVFFRRPSDDRRVSSGTQSATQTQVSAHVQDIVNTVLGSGNVRECRGAGDREAVDRCFTILAAALHDEALCQEIRDASTQSRCHDFSAVARVQAGGDPDDCLSISDREVRERCVSHAILNGAEEPYCAGFSGDTQVLCLDRVRMARALAGDTGACAGIVDEDIRDECFASLVSQPPGATAPPEQSAADRDGDGLSDSDEVQVYGTDPGDMDSDGDGFSDGTEVGNGYNPLGSGRLQ